MSTNTLLTLTKVAILILAALAAVAWLLITVLGWGISQIEFAPDTAISFPLTLLYGWGIILVVTAVPFFLIWLAEANARKNLDQGAGREEAPRTSGARDDTPPTSSA
jgi:hypothetical protein